MNTTTRLKRTHPALPALPAAPTSGTLFWCSDLSWAAPPAGSSNVGTATLDFGAFPGASDASIAVTGQTSIASGSIVQAWIRPADTADHSADEHMLESVKIFAGNIIAGTGFTIYGFNTSEIYERATVNNSPSSIDAGGVGVAANYLGRIGGNGAADDKANMGTRIYGLFTIAWSWA